MKRNGIIILLTIFVVGIISLFIYNSLVEPKKVVEEYYTALVEEDYDTAFSHLLIWDLYVDVGTRLEETEAKERYLEKMDFLKQKGYKVKAFDITDVREKNGDYLIDATVTIQNQKKEQEISETIRLMDQKLYITSSDDPYSHYRDGKMRVSFD